MLASSPGNRSSYPLPARPAVSRLWSRSGVPSTIASPWAALAVACLCAAAAALTLFSSIQALLAQWRSDDLKSMGLLVPFISLALILRAWGAAGWRTEGSWWGFTLLASLAALLFVRDQSLIIVTLGKGWLMQLPPLPIVAVLYALGFVLMLGGRTLLRAAWFPVLFMAAVIPVPQFFSHRVDLPLQHASATVARGFAHLLGQKLTPDNLRLMFTPDFGMFIAPGCNGIRGAVTLGLAAVVIAYVYRFRWYLIAPVVAGAVLLGYLFNFLRLCLLVIYYQIALPYPWLQERARGADLLLGGCLFALAMWGFFAVADRLRRPAPTQAPPPRDRASAPNRGLLARTAATVALAAIFGMDAVHAQRQTTAHAPQLPPMPARLGAYHLVRTYQDTLLDGVVVYTWGEYAAPDTAPGIPGAHVALGFAPELDVHDAEVCHIARGEEPTSHGQLTVSTVAGDVSLVGATYNNGTVQSLEASTVCDGGQCGQFTHSSGGATLVYAHPHRTLPMQWAPTRPVPVLVKVENAQAYLPVSAVGPEMTAQLKAFLANVNLAELASQFRRGQ